jgi:tetrahydromethanopterin S-methyltransferase subunit D
MALVPKLKTVTVTTAGTRVPLFASTDIPGNIVGLVLSAIGSAVIYYGDDTVSSTNGVKVTATAAIPLRFNDVIDLKKLYIDAGTNGDKASVLYFEKV